MFTDILWRFLLLETFVMGALSIFCVYEHPQQHFCNSEFVLKMKFRKETHLSVGYGYRMEIKNIFKGNVEKLDIMDYRYVNMELPRKLTLSAGNKYLIFGHNKNGSIYVNLCYGIKPWMIATKFYRRGLAKFYKKGCDCIDEMPMYTVAKDCHWKYSFLVRRGQNCSWKQTKDFRICQNRFMFASTS